MLDRYFRIVVILKALDGLLEVLGGLILIFVPISRLKGLVEQLATYEVGPGRHAFIGNFILSMDHHVSAHLQLFAVIYLLGHGSIKIFLTAALLWRRYRLYPYAMGFLIAFIGYQCYTIGYSHSIVLAVLTSLDVAIVVLTYMEWKRHRPQQLPPAE